MNNKTQKIISIAFIVIAVSIFNYFVIVPYRNNSLYNDCIASTKKISGMLHDSLWEKYENNEITDEEMSKEKGILSDGYEAAKDRCFRELKVK